MIMKKSVLVILSFLFFSPFILLHSQENDIDRCLEEYLDSLPPEQAISQIFLVNIQGNTDYYAVEYTSDNKPLVPGGALFFAYNLGDTIEESISFVSSIEKYCDDNSLLRPYLAVDQEGGLVNRLRSLSSTLPSAEKISEILGELGEADRSIVLLRCRDGLSWKEVSDKMSITEANARKRFERVRKRLMKGEIHDE